MEYNVNARFFEKVLEIKADTDAIRQDLDSLRRYLALNIITEDDMVRGLALNLNPYSLLVQNELLFNL